MLNTFEKTMQFIPAFFRKSFDQGALGKTFFKWPSIIDRMTYFANLNIFKCEIIIILYVFIWFFTSTFIKYFTCIKTVRIEIGWP